MSKNVVTDNHQEDLLQTSDGRAVLVAASTNPFRHDLANMLEQKGYEAIHVIPTSDNSPTNVQVAVLLLEDDVLPDHTLHYLDRLLHQSIPILLLHYAETEDPHWQALARRHPTLIRYVTGRGHFASDVTFHFLHSIREGNGLAASLQERRKLRST